MKALKDQTAVKIVDSFSKGFVESSCKPPSSYTIHLLYKSVNTTGGDCWLPGWYGADYEYWYGGDWFDTGSGRLPGETYTLTANPIAVNRNFNPFEIDGPNPDEARDLFLRVYGEQSLGDYAPPPYNLYGGSISAKKQFQAYPFADIPLAPESFEFSLDTDGPSTCPARWTFVISKTANY